MTMTTKTPLAILFVVAACHAPSRPLSGDAGATGDASLNAPAGDASAGSSDPFAALAAMPTVCSPDGWCWQWPLPSGTSYGHIVSTGPDNIWITGGGPPAYSLLLQWNGHTWTDHSVPVPPGYPPYLATDGLSMTGPDNAWMLYNNLLEHYDGTAWSVVFIFAGAALPLGVWADAKGDAWVGDGEGNIDLFTQAGDVIDTFSTGGFSGTIWGTADDDLFITTIGGVLHYDGSAVTRIYAGKTCGWYQGVQNDVWISGETILHWDGSAMTETDIEAGHDETAQFDAAGYVGSGDVSFALWGDPGGALAGIIHWDGSGFTTHPIDPASQITPLGDSRCGAFRDAQLIAGTWFVVCDGGAVATLGSDYNLVPVIDPIQGHTMWGTSTTNLYFATGDELQHFDGTTWMRMLDNRILALKGIAGAGSGGADELFGTHELMSTDGSEIFTTYFDHFDGATWTSTPLTQYTFGEPILNIADAYPVGPGEALIVGGQGNAFYFANGAVTPIASGTTADLYAVVPVDSDHLWIGGGSGTMLTWDRADPDELAVDPTFPSATTSEDLEYGAGAGGVLWFASVNSDDVWRRGSDGTWQDIDAHVAATSVIADGSDGLLISATDSGEVARWNGHAFAIEYYPSWFGLQRLFALPDGTTYLTGQRGTVIHAPAPPQN
jgi:hypothetical protein|nr:hypothetical protein [Kofleriaceae bacterium]